MVPITKSQREAEKQRIIDNQAFSWDQNIGEPNNAFSLFTLYRNIGKTRSYVKTCNLSDSVCYQTILSFANKYNWKVRSEDYDAAKDQEMIIELDDEILKNKLRSFNIGKEMQLIAEKGIEMLNDYTEELSANDIVKLADIGTKLTNLALGSSTEITETKIDAKVEVKVEEIPKEISEKIGKELAILASKKIGEVL